MGSFTISLDLDIDADVNEKRIREVIRQYRRFPEVVLVELLVRQPDLYYLDFLQGKSTWFPFIEAGNQLGVPILITRQKIVPKKMVIRVISKPITLDDL